MSADAVRFGPFRFDVAQRELSCGGVPVRLGGRAARILCVLAGAHGQVVSKDTLLAEGWPGLVVEENNLQVQISALRKALGEDTSGHNYVITVPSRGYRLMGLDSAARETPRLPARPSIAVLPVPPAPGARQDPEKDYFADGIVESIITSLCRNRWLFVIARNSSFAYKGHAVDVQQVGRDLGVRYVLEVGVRRATCRLRIMAQLVDAATTEHLWAHHFDGGVEDVFALQDEVSASVVGAILPKLERAEIERARRKPTESLDAYDYFLRGMACAHRVTREAIDEALMLFDQAIARDPEFASPYGAAAFCYMVRKINAWTSDRAREVAEAARLAARAAEFGNDDAVALAFGGISLGYVVGEHDGGVRLIDRALVLNPNLATAWYASGTVRAFRGDEPDVAIAHLARAMRLSPFDPLMFTMLGVTAFAHFIAGRYDEATAWAEKAFWERPNVLATLRITAASYALAGRMEDARRAVAHARELDPEMRLSNLRGRLGGFRRQQDYDKYADALRMAGLPE